MRAWQSAAPLWHIDGAGSKGSDWCEAETFSSKNTCHTVIIGAGITGLAIAEQVSQNHSVVVLEAGQIGQCASGWNAGILSVDTTVDLAQIEKSFGREQTNNLITSLSAILAETKASLNLPAEQWQSGSSLYVASKKNHLSLLEEEKSSRLKYNLPGKLIDQSSLDDVYNGFAGALRLDNEHAVHPVHLLLALANRIKKNGGKIYANTRALSWEKKNDCYTVSCQNGTVQSTNLVLASGLKNADFVQSQKLSRTTVAATGHILVTEPSGEFAVMVKTRGVIALWDSLQLYHYVRYLTDGRVLIGGEEAPGECAGEILTASDPHIKRLYRWAQKHHKMPLPAPAHCWKASLGIPHDGLPLISFRNEKQNNLVIAFADGLPSALLIGRVVDEALDNRGDNLAAMLGPRASHNLETKLLRALPSGSNARQLAMEITFAAMRLRDWAL